MKKLKSDSKATNSNANPHWVVAPYKSFCFKLTENGLEKKLCRSPRESAKFFGSKYVPLKRRNIKDIVWISKDGSYEKS